MDVLELYLDKQIQRAQHSSPETTVPFPAPRHLNDAEILRLQQLLSRNQQQQEEQQPIQPAILLEKTLAQHPDKKPFYENSIDPLWYLVQGPFVIVPHTLVPRMTVDDFVEYFRAYPRLCWSAYPALKQQIVAKLLPHEREMLRSFESYHREKRRRLQRLTQFVRFTTQQGWFQQGSVRIDKKFKYLIEDFMQLIKFWVVRFAWRILQTLSLNGWW